MYDNAVRCRHKISNRKWGFQFHSVKWKWLYASASKCKTKLFSRFGFSSEAEHSEYTLKHNYETWILLITYGIYLTDVSDADHKNQRLSQISHRRSVQTNIPRDASSCQWDVVCKIPMLMVDARCIDLLITLLPFQLFNTFLIVHHIFCISQINTSTLF